MWSVPTIVAILFSFASLSLDQPKPNLTGTWVVVKPAEAAGQEYHIKQDDSSFTQSHGSEGGGHSFRYLLDGKEHRLTLSSHGEEIVTLATATWKENRIVITGKTTYPNGRVMQSTQIWGLDESGQLILSVQQELDGKRTEVMLTAKRKN